MKTEDTTPNKIGPMHLALDRMKIAYESGKGVRLSWEELEAMNRSTIGEIWNETSPLDAPYNAGIEAP